MKKTILTLGTLVLFASGCGEKELPPTPVPVPKVEYKAPAPAPIVEKKTWDLYTVQKGDDLTKIGRAYDWGHNPSSEYFNKIQTKNNLEITPETDTRIVVDNFFVYDKGDFWYPQGLFPERNTFVGDGLVDKIYPGQKLYVPLPTKK